MAMFQLQSVFCDVQRYGATLLWPSRSGLANLQPLKKVFAAPGHLSVFLQ